jgi:hypothetical protein
MELWFGGILVAKLTKVFFEDALRGAELAGLC